MVSNQSRRENKSNYFVKRTHIYNEVGANDVNVVGCLHVSGSGLVRG